MLNDIAIRVFLSGRILLPLVGVLMLGACASIQPGKLTPPPLQTEGPAIQIEDVDVLALSPAMEKFLEHYVLQYSSRQTRLELLSSAVSGSGALDFHYDASQTLTASEAFETRTGNCIGFSNMLIALARRAGLNARYQEVFRRPEWSNHEDDTVLLVKHVNVVVKSRRFSWAIDVSGVKIHPNDPRRLIDDSYAKALYLNNIAVDALLRNDLPPAYAYMRSAIEANSEVIDPWVNLGVVYGRNDQLDDAVLALRQALRIDRGNYSAMSNLYEVYVEQGKFTLAAELEPRVEKYRRNNPYYLLRLSDEALELEQYEESVSLLQKAVTKKNDDHKLYFALAKTQYLSGEMTAAEKSLLRARELAPEAYYDRPLGELVAEQTKPATPSL